MEDVECDSVRPTLCKIGFDFAFGVVQTLLWVVAGDSVHSRMAARPLEMQSML